MQVLRVGRYFQEISRDCRWPSRSLTSTREQRRGLGQGTCYPGPIGPARKRQNSTFAKCSTGPCLIIRHSFKPLPHVICSTICICILVSMSNSSNLKALPLGRAEELQHCLSRLNYDKPHKANHGNTRMVLLCLSTDKGPSGPPL